MNPVIQPIVRRAIVDLLTDVGGEHNDEVLQLLLVELGHRVARREVREEMLWLKAVGLIHAEEVGPLVVGRVTSDGRDVAEGRLVFEGVSKHKTGE